MACPNHKTLLIGSQKLVEVNKCLWSSRIRQLFTKYTESDKDFIAIEKVFDDFLVICREQIIQPFIKSKWQLFNFKHCHINEMEVFNRIHISRQSDGSETYDLQEFLESSSYLDISRTRRREQGCKSLKTQIHPFLQPNGFLNLIGNGLHSQAVSLASHLQHVIASLSVFHFVKAHKVLRQMKS